MFRSSTKVVFAIMIYAVPAYANSTAQGQPVDYRDTPWANENEYQSCGQACLYEKGNEVITLDATYTIEKIGKLKAMPEADIPDALPGFCRDEETGDECRDRYIAVATRQIYESRHAMGTNTGSAYSLSNHKGATARPDLRKSGLKPQVASVITWDRVKDKISKTPTRVRTQQQWLDDVMPKAPNINDFVFFKAMPRDPNDPSAGSFMVPDDSAEGRAKQKKAFDEAMKAYEERVAEIKSDWEKNPEMKNYKPMVGDPKTPPQDKSLEFDAFQAARRNVIGAVNNRLEELGMVSKKEQPKSSGRAPSSKDADKSSGPQKGANVGVAVKGTPAAQPVNPADDPTNDFVRPVESSDERNDFVTFGWDPERLTTTATQGMGRTPSSGSSPTPSK